MLQKTRAIVLSSTKYGESSLVVRVLTESFGRLSFMVHGVRKKNSKYNPYLFEPLALITIDLYFKQNREMQSLRDIKPSVVLHKIHFDVIRAGIAVFISEIMIRTLKEVEINEELFNYLFNAIQILDVAEVGIENYHLVFLMHFSKFLGIYPKNHTDLKKYTIQGNYQLSDLLNISLSELGQIQINNTTRTALIDQTIQYYSDHLDGIGEIRSLSVLRSVFNAS